MEIKYSIFDPSGNITALVETNLNDESQAKVAAEIMKAHPEAEQLGFVYFNPARPVPAYLKMAGGEFCGNAAMSTAALYLIRSGDESEPLRVRVSGASHSLEVKLKRASDDADAFDAGIEMPAALAIEELSLSSGGAPESLPAVRMEGVTHVIIEEGRAAYALKDEPGAAEDALRACCKESGADCMGLMFLDESKDDIIISPLVYVPGADTMFWESSCASGSAAVGIYLSRREGRPVDLSLRQPGGVLRVASDAAENKTWLYGRTKLIGTYTYTD